MLRTPVRVGKKAIKISQYGVGLSESQGLIVLLGMI